MQLAVLSKGYAARPRQLRIEDEFGEVGENAATRSLGPHDQVDIDRDIAS